MFGFNRWLRPQSDAEQAHNLATLDAAPLFAPSREIQASPYTLSPADGGCFLFWRGVGPAIVLLPDEDQQQFPAWFETSIVQAGPGPVSIAAAGGVVLAQKDDTYAITNGFASIVTLKRVAADSWQLLGDYVGFDAGFDLVFYSSQQLFYAAEPVEHPV